MFDILHLDSVHLCLDSLWPSYTMWFYMESVNSDLHIGANFQQLLSASPDYKSG